MVPSSRSKRRASFEKSICLMEASAEFPEWGLFGPSRPSLSRADALDRRLILFVIPSFINSCGKFWIVGNIII